MDFYLKFPQAKVGDSFEIYEGVLDLTNRTYPCDICGKKTGWRKRYEDSPGHPICSEHCLGLTYQVRQENQTFTILNLGVDIRPEPGMTEPCPTPPTPSPSPPEEPSKPF